MTAEEDIDSKLAPQLATLIEITVDCVPERYMLIGENIFVRNFVATIVNDDISCTKRAIVLVEMIIVIAVSLQCILLESHYKFFFFRTTELKHLFLYTPLFSNIFLHELEHGFN